MFDRGLDAIFLSAADPAEKRGLVTSCFNFGKNFAIEFLLLDDFLGCFFEEVDSIFHFLLRLG